ncbi:MAG: 50S ribosomal protein L15 [Saprospiraceae bacterium]|nr:50S ribosomal protein L15 [Saprospiraceae bacterium]MBK8634863.1 50S ribosomal protein L15 [Saprospiraceae bacterium]HPN71488.1 50S ribosomal protein L15 [Saprospiraceae bacterium]
MELNSLRPAYGATKSTKRIARGQGSGHGGTSTRGHKGAKSRSGYKSKRGHEGGQMPLQMRLPKVGFKNVNRKVYVAVNVARLQELAEKHGVSTFDHAQLVALNVVGSNDKVKILGNGDVTSKLTLSFDKVSASAAEKIQAAGGSVASK